MTSTCTGPLRLFVLGLCLVAAMPNAQAADKAFDKRDVKQTLFFHWGRLGANTGVLKASGFPLPPNYPQDSFLSENDAGTLTEDMYKRMIADYKVERSDLGGVGLYISPLFDTWKYGSDLMVVEISDRQGRPIDIPFTPKFKAMSDAALNSAAKRAKLPVASQYLHENNWIVVARAPRADEDVVVKLRPPRPSDAVRIVKEVFDYHSSAYAVAFLANAAAHGNTREQKQGQDVSPGALEFFRAVVLDEGLKRVVEIKSTVARSMDVPLHLLNYAMDVNEMMAALSTPERLERAQRLAFKAFDVATPELLRGFKNQLRLYGLIETYAHTLETQAQVDKIRKAFGQHQPIEAALRQSESALAAAGACGRMARQASR